MNPMALAAAGSKKCTCLITCHLNNPGLDGAIDLGELEKVIVEKTTEIFPTQCGLDLRLDGEVLVIGVEFYCFTHTSQFDGRLFAVIYSSLLECDLADKMTIFDVAGTID